MFVAAYGLSSLMGPVASRGCRSAIGLAVGTLGLWVLVVWRTWPWSCGLVDDMLAAGPWLRLRTTVVGMVLIGILLEEELMWFLGWTGFFYVALLIGQTAMVIWILRVVDWKHNLWPGRGDEAAVSRQLSC